MQEKWLRANASFLRTFKTFVDVAQIKIEEKKLYLSSVLIIATRSNHYMDKNINLDWVELNITNQIGENIPKVKS